MKYEIYSRLSMDGGQALNQCLGCLECVRREQFARDLSAGEMEESPERNTGSSRSAVPRAQEPQEFKMACCILNPTAQLWFQQLLPSVPGEKPAAFWVGPAGIVYP